MIFADRTSSSYYDRGWLHNFKVHNVYYLEGLLRLKVPKIPPKTKPLPTRYVSTLKTISAKDYTTLLPNSLNESVEPPLPARRAALRAFSWRTVKIRLSAIRSDFPFFLY
jgi:hypothetical protein